MIQVTCSIPVGNAGRAIQLCGAVAARLRAEDVCLYTVEAWHEGESVSTIERVRRPENNKPLTPKELEQLVTDVLAKAEQAG